MTATRLHRGVLWICLVLIAASGASADLFDTWDRRMTLTVASYGRSEALTNFPVLVQFAEGSNGFSYASMASLADAADLRFVSADGQTELPYEIESWNTAGVSFVWVRTTITGATDSISACWGRSGQSAPAYRTNGATWADNYAAVWHLDDAADNNNALDAAPSARHLANTLSTNATGVIAGGQGFNATTWMTGASGIGDLSVSGMTISAWVCLTNATYSYPMALTYGGVGSMDLRFLTTTRQLQQLIGGSSLNVDAANAIPLNEWHHVASSLDDAADALRLYVDGRMVKELTGVTGHAPASGTLYLARRSDTYRFYGLLDEVRVSSLARSTNWIWASFMNQASNRTFLSYGDMEPWGIPAVENTGGASNVTTGSADLWGALAGTGSAPVTVWAFWGPSDGGTNKAAWSNVTELGERVVGALVTNVTGLAADTTYYYAYYASNASGDAWAAPSESFLTSGVWIEKTADASEEGLVPGAFVVCRSESVTGAPVVVEYAQTGGDAVSGFNYAPLSGSVTIPAGATNAAIVVTPRKDYVNQAPTTLELTLRASRIVVVAPSNATMTIGSEAANVWIRAGTNTGSANASVVTNWSLGHAPTNGEVIYLGTNSPVPGMVWDITNVVPREWYQAAGYSGVVSIATRYPGQGVFSNFFIAGDCAILGGSWTHPANAGGATATDWLRVSIAGDLAIAADAAIDVTGKGFAAGLGPGAGNSSQRSALGKGASHGGLGAYDSGGTVKAPTYGSPTAPTTLGSGAYTGTRGGGAAVLDVAGGVGLEGDILADALFVRNLNPGASGGSVNLRAASLVGNGLLSARGEIGYQCGGGGRVAVVLTNSTDFAGLRADVRGALHSTYNSAAGTIYREGWSGGAPAVRELRVDNQTIVTRPYVYTELPPSGESYDPPPTIAWELEDATLVVTNTGAIGLPQSMTMGDFAWLSASATVQLEGATLYLKADEPPNPFPGSYGGGTVVSNGGRIVWGSGSVSYSVIATAGPHGSAAVDPADPENLYAYGSNVTLTATPDAGYDFLWWEGTIPAGGDRTNNPLTFTVSEAAALRALFASAAPDVSTWTGDGMNALASTASNWYPVVAPTSGSHILFDATSVKSCTWDLDIEPASWTQNLGYADSYSVAEGFKGWVSIGTRFPGQGSFTNLRIAGNATLLDGAWTHPANSGGDTEIERLSVSLGGDFTLSSNAAVDVTGRGFAYNRGPGAGNSLQRSPFFGLGASHGGRGAHGVSNPPASTYGSITAPTNHGSGGALAAGADFRGGGSVQIHAAGELAVDGTVSADALFIRTTEPGAAGGSIWLRGASLLGGGLVTASGAGGYQGGGGGRIAVNLSQGDGTGEVRFSVKGGEAGPIDAAAGTLYLQMPGRAELRVNNEGIATTTNVFTEIPAALAAQLGVRYALDPATLVVTNLGYAALASDVRMRDLMLRTNTAARLILRGHKLYLRTAYHDDWGGDAWVIYDGGDIVWVKPGTVFMVK